MDKQTVQSGPLYMPNGEGGAVPAPTVMTEADVIKFLRLDVDGPKKPHLTLRYYRETGQLKAKKIGKQLRYTQKNILDFLS